MAWSVKAQSELLIDNFESYPPTEGGSISTYGWGWNGNSNYCAFRANPAPDALNGSAMSMYTQRVPSDLVYTGPIFSGTVFNSKFTTPISGYSYLHIEMYNNIDVNVPKAKVSDAAGGDIPATADSQAGIASGKWVDVVFPISGISVNYVMIEVDTRATAAIAATEAIWVDNIVLNNDPNPRTATTQPEVTGIGSMIETGVALYPNDNTAPPVPGIATPVSGLSFDYKLVTVGSTTWAWTNVTGITLSHNSYSSQFRYWPTTGAEIENNLTNYPSGTQQSYGTASNAQPNNPVTITFFQEQNNVFYETSGYTYDNTIANSADASDKTAPVLTCDSTSTSGLNLQLNLAATDDSGNYFYYIVDPTNGIQDVSFFDGSYQKGLSAGTDYDIKVYAIDFSGNESAPTEFKFSTPVIDYSEVPSEYCSTQFGAGSANGTAALMTMITDSDGNFYMMIAPDPTTGDAGAAFRNLGYNDDRAQAITVNGNPNTGWKYFTRTMSPDFSYIEFTPVTGMMKPGDKVYINQTLEYETTSNTNAWPTIPFTYTYGTTCEGVEPPEPPTPLPTPETPAPTPTIPAANVMSMFSSAYTTYNWFNPGTSWGSATQVSTVSIQGTPTWMFSKFDYQGFEFVGAGGTWDVSGMNHLHLDVWSPNLTNIQVNIGGADYTCTPLTPSEWNSFDIPITALVGSTTLDLTDIQIIKFTADGPSTAENLAYLDNVYFYTDMTSIPNISAGNAVVVGGQSSISATFDGAATVAVYSVQGVLIKKTNAQSAFEIGNLPSGIYLVKINNSVYKAVVK